MPAEGSHKNGEDELRGIDEQSRRFACDRCRSQKLRCERRIVPNSSNSCNRCVKSRVKCITSPPRRMGRPKQQPAPIHSTIPDPHELDFDTLFNAIDPCDSLKNGFELRDAAGSNASAMTTSANNQGHGGESGNEAQQADERIDFVYNPQQLLTDTPMFHGDQDFFNRDDLSQGPLPDLKEECLQKLSDLSADLFRQWSRISSGQLADSLFFSPPTSNSQVTDPPNGIALNNAKSPIGKMLDSSREFMDVLRYFVRSPSNQSSNSAFHSSPSSCYSDFGLENLSGNHVNMSSNHPSSPAYNYQISRVLSFGSSSASLDFTSPDSFGPLRSDVLTALPILTCYICLVRIYRTIFSHIHNQLLARPSQAELTSILPGLQLGGFQLESHRNLQIRILMQVSVHMLDQIESALGLPDDICTAENAGSMRRGILEDSVSTALLEVVMKQEATDCAEGDRAGIKSLRNTWKSINRLLDGRIAF